MEDKSPEKDPKKQEDDEMVRVFENPKHKACFDSLPPPLQEKFIKLNARAPDMDYTEELVDLVMKLTLSSSAIAAPDSSESAAAGGGGAPDTDEGIAAEPLRIRRSNPHNVIGKLIKYVQEHPEEIVKGRTLKELFDRCRAHSRESAPQFYEVTPRFEQWMKRNQNSLWGRLRVYNQTPAVFESKRSELLECFATFAEAGGNPE